MSQILICISRSLMSSSRKACLTFGTNAAFRTSENLSAKGITFQMVRNACKFSFQRPAKLPVIQPVKRCFAKKPGKLSFEVSSNVAHDATVFTYSNARFFRMLSIFGIVQFFFWANMAMFSYSGMSGLEKTSNQDRDSWWTMVLNFQVQHKYRIAVACVALGYVVLFFTWIYPLRTVARLVLEKGGQMVRITTYTHFGKTKDFVVPLNDISCTQSRLAKGVQVSLKVRGKRFYYLLDKREGQFVDPHLFDYVIGLNRSLK